MDIHVTSKAAMAEPLVDIDALAECIEACTECSQSCTACADACLSDSDIKDLTQCIRLDQHCADVTDTTGRLLSRAADTPPDVIRSMLQTCITVCQACANECDSHAEQHVHCRLCAESSRKCAATCEKVIAGMEARIK